ncbi:MAG: hypothetical protein JSW67_00895 [Candidatus Latescibacterota bacterium]|nr:MAG: hypothetical protein JSW67_00895 [Candidatus Latescibacterota bacterium]
MGKVEVKIRCNRCDAVETVVTEAWSRLKTSCGCAGPYRVLERNLLPDDDHAGSDPSTATSRKG